MNFTMNVRVKVSCNLCGARLDVAQALTTDDGLSLVVDPHECSRTQRAADECPTCAGLGFVNDDRGRRGVDCSDCNGSGIRR